MEHMYILCMCVCIYVYMLCVCVCVCDDTHSVTTRKEETIPSFFFPALTRGFFFALTGFFFSTGAKWRQGGDNSLNKQT